MKKISHAEQRRLWDEEHRNPHVLPQMDSEAASSGVVLFRDWLDARTGIKNLRGLDMGCGKGRNAIWLALQGAEMTGFDFSVTATEEAGRRAVSSGVRDRARFITQDATEPWPFESGTFDFAVDCFASTDIESPEGRVFARDEVMRVLRPGGHLLVYTLSTDDEFHKGMLVQSPGPEKNSFLHPESGKFEKVFDREELAVFYKDLHIAAEQRVPKTAKFFGKDYDCNHYWFVFMKK